MFRNPVTDVIVVLVVALLIFGPKRLPMLGRSLGQGLKEFKDSITGDSHDDEADERPALAPPSATDAASAPAAPAATAPAGAAPPAAATPAAPPAAAAPGTAAPQRESAEVGSSEHRS
jgi:sec-independent protein translocase protein TatA